MVRLNKCKMGIEKDIAKGAVGMNIQIKWINSLLVVALVAFVGSIFSLNQIRIEVKSNTVEQQTVEVRSIEKEVNHWLLKNIDLLKMHQEKIGHLTFEELNYSKTENKFVRINYQEHQVDAIYVGLEDGTFITGKNWIPANDYDPRVRPWYMGAIKTAGVYIGDAYIDSDTKKMICTFSLPIRTLDGYEGVIAIDVYMNTVAEWMNTLVRGTDFGVALLDEQGVIIHYTGDNYLAGKPVKDFPNSRISKLHQAYIDHKMNGNEQFVVNENEVVLFNRVNNSTWTIMIFNNDTVVFSTIDKQLRRLQIANAILFLLCLGGIIITFKMKHGLKENAIEMERVKIECDETKNTIIQSEQSSDMKTTIDPLTRIYNRQYGDEQFEKYWGMSLKNECQIGLMLIDLDYFSRYNDHYGYALGNQQLINMAKTIGKLIEPNHVLVRYGGNTFMILSYQVELGEMEALAEKMCHSIFDLGIANQMSPYECLTVSIGVASFIVNPEESMGESIYKVFGALYEAKRLGRNRVVIVN